MPMVTRPQFLPGLPNWSRKTFFAVALALICFAFAFPVLWLILTSLRPPDRVFDPGFFPQEIYLKNYSDVFRYAEVGIWFRNSLIIGILAVVTVVCSCLQHHCGVFRVEVWG